MYINGTESKILTSLLVSEGKRGMFACLFVCSLSWPFLLKQKFSFIVEVVWVGGVDF